MWNIRWYVSEVRFDYKCQAKRIDFNKWKFLSCSHQVQLEVPQDIAL